MDEFNYDMAFSRNLGWLTEEEQLILKTKKIAVAGLGGVGGLYIETLARLGVTTFHIADFDSYEVSNFNRQTGANVSTLNVKKTEVMKKKLLDINPEIECTVFERGINESNLNDFLAGVDIYLDGLDFFVFDIRILLYQKLEELKIPAILVAPVGMGASLIAFKEGSMNFEKYFGMSLYSTPGLNACRFFAGLTPAIIQRRYLVDLTKVNFSQKRVPSNAIGCYLASGIAASTALKILLKRGSVYSAPWVLHFDAYLNIYKKSYLFFGSKNPIQIQKVKLIKKLTMKG
jgi:molybdopterin/thiamine biosynthesis adenylyltransferase